MRQCALPWPMNTSPGPPVAPNRLVGAGVVAVDRLERVLEHRGPLRLRWGRVGASSLRRPLPRAAAPSWEVARLAAVRDLVARSLGHGWHGELREGERGTGVDLAENVGVLARLGSRPVEEIGIPDHREVK